MTDTALQRTVRRGVALLSIQLSVLLLRSGEPVAVPEGRLPGAAWTVGVAALVAAALYLLASGGRQVFRAADTPF